MAVWFASAAAASALARSAPLSGFESALLTSAVQAGFVCGTLRARSPVFPIDAVEVPISATGLTPS